jgi:hypothetical protein
MRKNEGIARAKEHTLEAKERVRMYQLLPTDEQRRARIARISAHYNRELQRLKRGTGSWRQLALLFLVGIAIIVGAASFNNELVLLIGLLLAIVPFFIGAGISNKDAARQKYYSRFGARRLETIDKFVELEKRISKNEPFGIYLRSFALELVTHDIDFDFGFAVGERVDTRDQEAIRELIGYDRTRITFAFFNLGDPVHSTLFPEILADPERWQDELRYLLSAAAWIIVSYNAETKGLKEELQIVAEDPTLAEKCIFVTHDWVRETDDPDSPGAG